jgi:hypothetical protein
MNISLVMSRNTSVTVARVTSRRSLNSDYTTLARDEANIINETEHRLLSV